MNVLPVFIGYDRREHEAYEVCRASMERRSSVPLDIKRLDLTLLQDSGLYERPYHVKRSGQRIDVADGRPFSTDFAFSRFLVPALSLYQGWALFCDCDFLFTADLAGLLKHADDRYAVMCVKHDHKPIERTKMNGVAQGGYPRKNWSSLVLWNCAHPANACMTVDCVSRMPGRWLHAFSWLSDDKIGDLPITWNWLSGVNEPFDSVPCGVHYTLGGPWFENCQDVPLADLWRAERTSRRALNGLSLPTERERAFTA